MMEFETEADEPAALVKALTPSCPHPTATKTFYLRDDGSFLALCGIDGLSAEAHALPPGFKRQNHMTGVEAYKYDKTQARLDMEIHHETERSL